MNDHFEAFLIPLYNNQYYFLTFIKIMLDMKDPDEQKFAIPHEQKSDINSYIKIKWWNKNWSRPEPSLIEDQLQELQKSLPNLFTKSTYNPKN